MGELRGTGTTTIRREISIRDEHGEEVAWIEKPGGAVQVLPGRELDALRICMDLLLWRTRRR